MGQMVVADQLDVNADNFKTALLNHATPHARANFSAPVVEQNAGEAVGVLCCGQSKTRGR